MVKFAKTQPSKNAMSLQLKNILISGPSFGTHRGRSVTASVVLHAFLSEQ